MKKVRCMAGMMMLVMLMVGGCQAAVTPEQMQQLAASVETLNTQMDGYQVIVDGIAEQVKQVGFITPEQQAQLTKAQEEVDRLQPQVKAITAAVKNADYTNGDSLTTVLEAIRAGNKASAPFNPYSGIIEVVLGLGTLLLGIFAKKKSDEAAVSADDAAVALAKYTAHKQGVELTMKQVSASTIPEVKAVETKLYENIGAARVTNGVAA